MIDDRALLRRPFTLLEHGVPVLSAHGTPAEIRLAVQCIQSAAFLEKGERPNIQVILDDQ